MVAHPGEGAAMKIFEATSPTSNQFSDGTSSSILLGSTVGSFVDQPSALLPINNDEQLNS
jgi:hypothetical protein